MGSSKREAMAEEEELIPVKGEEKPLLSSNRSLSRPESSSNLLFRSYNSLTALIQVENDGDIELDDVRHGENGEWSYDDENDPFSAEERKSGLPLSAGSSSNRKKLWKWLVLFVLIPSFLQKSCQRLTIPVIPEFVRNTLHGTDAQIGYVVASVGAGRLISNVPCGYIIGTWGSYKGLLWSCIVSSIAWFLSATSTTIWMLVFSSLLEGLGTSLWTVSRQNLVTSTMNADQGRGKVQATVGGLERMSSVVGPSVGGFVALAVGIRAPFFVKSIVMAMDAFWFLLLTMCNGDVEELDPLGNNKKEKEKEKEKEKDKDIGSTYQSQNSTIDTTSITATVSVTQVFWKNRENFRLISLFLLFFPVARETRLFLFPLKAMDLNYSPDAIGIMTSLTFIVDSCMFPVAGYLMDKYGRKYSAVPSALLMAISYVIAPFANNIYTLTLASALSGIGNGLSCGVVNSIGSDLASVDTATKDKNSANRWRAMFLALYRTIADTGVMTGPLVAGAISQRLSIADGFFVIGSTTFSAALWIAFVMPETRW